jgi:hypothetical protein
MNIDARDCISLRALLKVGILTIEFTKADSSHRRMVCTLVPEFLDAKPHDWISWSRQVSNGFPMPVFDLEENDWRSFVPNRLISVSWEPADRKTIQNCQKLLKIEDSL